MRIIYIFPTREQSISAGTILQKLSYFSSFWSWFINPTSPPPLYTSSFPSNLESGKISIYILCMSIFLSVSLYPLNVKTAELIRPKFKARILYGTSRDPRDRVSICKTFAQFLQNETQNFSFFAHQFCAKKQQFAQSFAKVISRKIAIFRFCKTQVLRNSAIS